MDLWSAVAMFVLAAGMFYAGYQHAANVYTRKYCDRLHVLIDKVEAFIQEGKRP